MPQGAMAGPGGTSSKRRRRRRRPEIGRFVFLGAFLIFVLGPLYWMFITSIKPSDDYLAVPPVWFPSHPTLVHYTAALFAYRGLQGIVNSLIISISATALSALVGTLMAYSFARFETGGKHLSFWVLSQLIPTTWMVDASRGVILRGAGWAELGRNALILWTMALLSLALSTKRFRKQLA